MTTETSALGLREAIQAAARQQSLTLALIALLRVDPEARRLAQAEVDLAASVVAARGEGACHLTASTLRVLGEALAQAAAS